MSRPLSPNSAILKRKAHVLLQQGNTNEAKILYEEILNKDEADAEVHYLLGSIYGQLGKFEESVICFQHCIDQKPNAFAAYCGLGAALKTLGQYQKSERTFRDALRLQPGNTAVLLDLANVLVIQNDLNSAEECVRVALQNSPDSPEILHMIGEILHVQQKYPDAIRYYERTLSIDPKRAITHNQLGKALHQIGKQQEAINHYQYALKLDPALADACQDLASTYIMLGYPQEARAIIRKMLGTKPDNVAAISLEISLGVQEGDYDKTYKALKSLINRGIEDAGLALNYLNICRRFDCCTDAIDYTQRILVNCDNPVLTEKQLQFALGDAYDSIEEYDKAFTHFKLGNEFSADHFNAVEHAEVVDNLIQVWTQKVMEGSPRATLHSRRPVFIVGMPRSGTSLTEQILASHPDVYGAGELSDISNIACALSGANHNARTKITTDLLNDYAQQYLGRINEMDPTAKYVTDKMPQNFLYLPLISLLFPEARVIHCTRDPRDTCLSIYFQNFNESHIYANRLNNIGFYFVQYQRLIQHYMKVIDLPVMELRYEDLVEKQESMTRSLIEFTGLTWDDRCLSFHNTKRHVATASYNQVKLPMYSKSVGRWRHYKKHLAPLFKELMQNKPESAPGATDTITLRRPGDNP